MEDNGRVLERWMKHFRELLNKDEQEEEAEPKKQMMVVIW